MLANRNEIAISKEYNLISMYVNPKTQMFSLKFDANKDLMSVDAVNVDAVILGKDKLTIVGDFKVKTGKERNFMQADEKK